MESKIKRLEETYFRYSLLLQGNRPIPPKLYNYYLDCQNIALAHLEMLQPFDQLTNNLFKLV